MAKKSTWKMSSLSKKTSKKRKLDSKLKNYFFNGETGKNPNTGREFVVLSPTLVANEFKMESTTYQTRWGANQYKGSKPGDVDYKYGLKIFEIQRLKQIAKPIGNNTWQMIKS